MSENSSGLPLQVVAAPPQAPAVYAAIAAVGGALAKSGIAKSRQNKQQGYAFRGIDEVYNSLSPLLAEHKLVVLPRILTRAVTERETKTGGVLFYVVIEAEFDFVSALDGSQHTVRTYGEAMDSADKATNKAMSAAYKYAALMTFAIPTEGDNDADAVTHEVAPKKAVPAGFEDWLIDLEATALEGTAKLQAAWADSPKELRAYLTETDKPKWERIKAKATANEPQAVPA